MKHLTDLDELLARTNNEEIRLFIAEASRCYSAGAYRGTIVLASLALFEDLRRKLSELATINIDAKTICKEVERRVKEQELFESYLADQLASSGIISPLDKSIITKLREHRNKAAHPTGHEPSAEEARYVLYEVVTRFLEQPTLYTTQRVDEILIRLKSDNYFPSNQIQSVYEIAKSEISRLHPGVFPYLVKNLRESIEKTTDIEGTNISYFITGLALHSKTSPELKAALRQHYIERATENLKHGDSILCCASNNPKLFDPPGDPVFERFIKILESALDSIEKIESTAQKHPSHVIKAFKTSFGPDYIIKNLATAFDKYKNKRPFEPIIVTISLSSESTKKDHLDIICQRASSSNFSTANDAADNLPSLDKILAEKLSPEENLRILCSLIRAADWGAWNPSRLRAEKFASLPSVKSSALSIISTLSEADFTSILQSNNISSESKESFINLYFQSATS